MADDPKSPPRPIDRRHFFRQGLRELLAKVDEVTRPVQKFAQELSKLESAGGTAGPSAPGAAPTASLQPGQRPSASPAPRPVTFALPLRPPGALPEADFLDACTRCGECVKACPVQAIVADPAVASGAPYILPERQPCTLCEPLACMTACPTGALGFVPRLHIRIGRAHWGAGKCLRSGGELCTLCVEACPVGNAALDINADGEIEVHDACTGCGVCQYVCPTTPRAIVVTPLRPSAA
ncbi:MAG: 4Fe-4S dicluster domain-containing protein [Tepidisphaerales bacterium]